MIEDREYLKRDLARIYTPHTRQAKSAMKKLREDINRCPELVEALQQQYTPHTRQAKSAMKKLREDINRCPELVEALQQQTRWNRNRNYYTARQVRLIAEYLCID